MDIDKPRIFMFSRKYDVNVGRNGRIYNVEMFNDALAKYINELGNGIVGISSRGYGYIDEIETPDGLTQFARNIGYRE